METQKDLWHKRHSDFESFDRIEFKVVPRYKTSGMSGDEWRQHVEIEFYFKGEVVHRAGARGMQSALMLAGAEFLNATCPIPERVIELEKTKCDQPSCEADAVGRYELKRETSERGDYLDPAENHFRHYRQFCARHAQRGDCSREDADDNYIPLDVLTPDASTNIEESPSAAMTIDVDGFLGRT